MNYPIPKQPENSFRIAIELEQPHSSLYTVVLEALHNQDENQELSHVSKALLKRIFTQKRVLIKGQPAKVKSSVNSGRTYVDILLEDN